MRTVKALLVFLVLFLSLDSLKAQVRIFGGPQITSAKYTIRNAKQPTEFKPNFMAGISLRSLIEGPLYFAPALYYSQKGYKVSYNRPATPPDSGALNNNTTINTIAFAPLFQFNLSGSASHAFIRFGPGVDVGVSGREIFDSTGGKTTDRPMVFSSTAYSPATAFASLQLGYEHRSGLILFAHYEHGLSSLNNADRGPMILHRVAGISVGWKL